MATLQIDKYGMVRWTEGDTSWSEMTCKNGESGLNTPQAFLIKMWLFSSTDPSYEQFWMEESNVTLQGPLRLVLFLDWLRSSYKGQVYSSGAILG